VTNVRISGASNEPRSESDIRLNYGDPSKIIASANKIGSSGDPAANFAQLLMYSPDGGGAWGRATPPFTGSDSLQSDPAVDWTSDGTAWTVTIGVSFPGGVKTLQLRCYKSTDGGQTWTFDSTPSGTQTACDREIMWVDHSPTSPYKDQTYVTYHNGSPAFAAVRAAGGAWAAPLQVSGTETTGTAIGGDVKSNSVGDVFVFWPDNGGSRQIYVAKSVNGGNSFAAAVPIASIFASNRQLFVPANASRGARVYVSGGAYRTASKDMVYALWTDLSGQAGCTSGNGPGTSATSTCKTRIWFSRSTNGGTAGSWSTPVMLNNQSSLNDQFDGRLCVDESNGNLMVIYYDTVADPNRLRTDVWMQSSTDDGQTWSSAVKVTTAQTDETAASADSGNQYGDYIGLSGFYGNFWPSWTDRRSGAAEEIWTSQLSLVQKLCYFIVDKSTFGQDEVQAMLMAGQPTVSGAFYVVLEGFSAAQLGITAADLVGVSAHRPTLSTNPSPAPFDIRNPGVGNPNLTPVRLLAEDNTLPPTPQRFTYVYDVTWTSAAGFTMPTQLVTLNASMGGMSGTAQIELIQAEDPYEIDGQTFWLSTDLRVFYVKQGGPGLFGATVGGSTSADAINFIHNALANLNSGMTGGQTFEGTLDPNGTAVALNQFDAMGNAIFNFAIAKVRYRALSQDAQATRVFFRLFPALTVSLAFDPNTTYRTSPSAMQYGHRISKLGLQNNNILSIPCFAAARTSSSGSMDNQQDPDNVFTIPHNATGQEVVHYYGCWLDINQPGTGVFPLNPTNDGPYTGAGLKSVLELVRNAHQCLVAEIAYDPDYSLATGVTPATSDKLAQRNLTLVPSANPGDVASRRIPSAFELKPTQPETEGGPDELMIDWGNLPKGSTARVYLPTVAADEVLELAAKGYYGRHLARVDDHTIGVPVPEAGVSYLPIPPGPELNHTGVLTIDLPPGVRKGQRFHTVVRQVGGAHLVEIARAAAAEADAVRAVEWTPPRLVRGTFQVDIPVDVKEALLVPEENLYSILRWSVNRLPPSDRWYLAFKRYVEEIGQRVAGLGGNPTQIPPTPGGWWPPLPHPPGRGPEERLSWYGKVAALVFDRFGDFEGFVLDTEDGERTFHSREPTVEDLAREAWAERIALTVVAERDAPHRPLSIIFRHASRDLS
jgi:hypothetical protein